MPQGPVLADDVGNEDCPVSLIDYLRRMLDITIDFCTGCIIGVLLRMISIYREVCLGLLLGKTPR